MMPKMTYLYELIYDTLIGHLEIVFVDRNMLNIGKSSFIPINTILEERQSQVTNDKDYT